MKTLIAMLMILATSLIYAGSAYCWDCPPKKCWSDYDCEYSCFCWMGEYQIEGRCVAR